MDPVEVVLIKCFQVVFPQVPKERLPFASVDSVSNWDSVATVNLISLIHEEFVISIDAEEVEHFSSFAKILALVQQKVQPRS